MLGEGLLLSLAGALAGIALGIAGGELLVRVFDAVRPGDRRASSSGALARALLVAAAMGTLGSLYPAWWVTRLTPARALG